MAKSHHFEGAVMNIQTLKALMTMGIPYEQAYAQCWKDLRDYEVNSKPKPLGNGMVGNSAQAKINAAKRWGKKK